MAVDTPTSVTGKGLAPSSVGTWASAVFSIASTAPAYSLAVSVGLLASMVGDFSPLLLIVAAVPMVAVVFCFAELNAAEPDCGTCYAWTSRAFGRPAGMFTGWVVVAACVLVLSNLTQMAAIYSFTVIGADSAAESRTAQAILGVLLLGVMSLLAHRGITVAARTQVVLLVAELLGVLWFAGKALLAEPLPDLAAPEVTVSLSGFTSAFLVAVFLYWGWDSSFSVNEESLEPARTPAVAALFAMAALVVLYAGFAWALTAYAGAERLAGIGEEDLFAMLADQLLGSTGGTLLAGAVLASALASAQTTILPSARSVVSMAHRGDLPAGLATVTANGSPAAATWSVTGLAAAAYVVLVHTSDAMLADTVAATAILVSFYYLVTCVTVPAFFGFAARRRPVRRIVLPVITAAVFAAALVASARDASVTTMASAGVVALIGVVYLASCSWQARRRG